MRLAKFWLTFVVASLYLAACLLPGFWGRGGFLEGGTEVPGWCMVIGLPPLCCLSWPSILAMYYSAKWVWQDRYQRAFILACLNILPGAYWLAALAPGRFELRSGYYVWLTALVVWAVGVGCLRMMDRGKRPPFSQKKSVRDEL